MKRALLIAALVAIALALSDTLPLASAPNVAAAEAPTPSGATMPSPANFAFDAPPTQEDPVPNWTASAHAEVRSDGPWGNYSYLPVGVLYTSSIRSDWLTLPGSAAILTYNLAHIYNPNNPGDNHFEITLDVQGGPQQQQVDYVYGGECDDIWRVRSFDVSNRAGQVVRFRILSSGQGALGIDNFGANLGLDVFGGAASTDDPVDTSTGAFLHSHTDILIPGRGMPLEFTRSYTSQSDYAGSLGHRWTHNYEMRLENVQSGDPDLEDWKTVRYPTGQTATFKYVGGSYQPPHGSQDTLTDNGDGTYTLTTRSQVSYNFDSEGKLTSIADRNGNTTTLAYDVDGYLSTVTEPGGRQLVFDVDAEGRITQITDPLTRTVGFTYDVDGDLVTVTDVKGGEAEFTYDNHRMLTVEDANDNLQTTNTYDTANRVVEQTDAMEEVTCIYYGVGPSYTSENCPGVSPAPVPGQTIVVDQRTHKTTFYYDKHFRTEATEDSFGKVTLFTYEAPGALCSPADDGNLCSVTDPLDHTTRLTYDANGNVLSVTDPLSNPWTFTYTDLNDIEVETDPLGRQTEYGYDASGNLTSITRKDELGTPLATTNLVRDPDNGDLTEIEDANHHTTSFTYDSYGLLDTVDGPLTGPPNDLTDYQFDIGGRLTSVTDAESNATSFAYDVQNNVTQVIDAENASEAPTSYGYDAKGNRVSVSDASRHAVGSAETGIEECGASGTGNGADDDGDTVKDDGCPSSLFAYDEADRLTSVTDALGRVTSYEYDEAGNLEQRTDARGLVTEYFYDEVDRLTRIEYRTGETLTDEVDYTYYDDGLRQSMTDSTGTTSYEYFANHQLENVTGSSGDVVQYTYDAVGNRESITYPDPTKVVEYEYDAFDRMETVTDWLGNETVYDYDSVGNLEETTYPAGTGLVSTRIYDDADGLTSVVNENGGGPISSFEYELDAVANRTRVVDDAGLTQYAYDDLYRLETVVGPESELDTYTYDEAGNRLTRQGERYAYDDADEMVSAFMLLDTDGDGCTDEEEVGEDPALGGQRDPDNPYDFYDVPVPTAFSGGTLADRDWAVSIMKDVLAVLEYSGTSDGGPPNAGGRQYNQDNNGDGLDDGLLYDRSPGATWSDAPDGAITMIQDVLLVLAQTGHSCAGPLTYAYDENGNQTGRGADSFEYDHENRLVEAVVEGITWLYGYNGDGLRVSRSVDGATTEYTWDVGSALPVILQETSGGGTTYYVYGLDLIASIEDGVATYLVYDGLGSTRQLADGGGSVVGTYEYDAFGSVHEHSGVQTEWTYTGEQGDPNGLVYLRARYYDPAIGRFLSRDPARAGHPYVYVGNNPVNSVDPSGLDGDEPKPFPLPLNPEEVEAKCTEELEICLEYGLERGFRRDAFPFVCGPLYLDCLESKTAFFDRSVYEARYGSFPKVPRGSGPYFSNLIGWLKTLDPRQWRLPATGTGGYLSADKEGRGLMCDSWQPFAPRWPSSSYGWRGIW